MDDMIVLGALAVGVFYFWPQIQAAISGTPASTSVTTPTAPVVQSAAPTVMPNSTPVVSVLPSPGNYGIVQNPPILTPPTAAVAAPVSYSTYTPPAAATAPIVVSAPAAANLIAQRYTIQQLHDLLAGIEGTEVFLPGSVWSGLLEQQTGIHLDGSAFGDCGAPCCQNCQLGDETTQA